MIRCLRRRPLRLAVLAGLLALLPAAAAAVDFGDGVVRLRTGAWEARTGPPPAAGPVRARGLAPGERGGWIVAFEGPADRWMRDTIEGTGAVLAGYVPSAAWLVRATPDEAAALRGAAGVVRVERLRPGWKLDPELAAAFPGIDGRLALVLLLFDDARVDDVAREVRAAGGEPVGAPATAGVRRLHVLAARDRLPGLATLPGVAWIEARATVAPRNDVVRWVVQSNVPDSTPLHDRGLWGAGEIVGHIDGPIAATSCFFLDPAGTPIGPDHRKLVAWRVVPPPGSESHGTHTAGTLAGDQEPVNGFVENAGMAPLARIAHTSWYELDGEYNGAPSNLLDLLLLAHGDGARVHSNSWGDDDRTGYTSWCLDADTFTRQHEDDLVVFATTNFMTLRSPENAKNVLAVGGTRRPPLQDQHRIGGSGPTADGRRKPDVLAPAEATRSASVLDCATTTSTGTSMAAPAVAGTALLVREYFVRGWYPTGAERPADSRVPTGALLKAVMINSAVDMAGLPGYPGDREGWGRILVDDALYFDGETRRLWLRDVRHADGVDTGESREWRLAVRSDAEPLKLTLAWADAPGTASAAVWTINDLDLEVEGPDGALYRGNTFDVIAGESIEGGAADPVDTVERVIRNAPAPGDWTVRVRGTSVPEGPQGFALVANGDLDDTVRLVRDVAPEPRPGIGGGDPAVALGLGPFRPNPFRGEASFSYRLPRESRVVLRVHDTAGRTVRTLLDRVVGPGDHPIVWNGRDDRGRLVVPGVYLFRLEAAGETRTARGVLLR